MTDELRQAVTGEIREAAARERRQGWLMLYFVVGQILTLVLAVGWTAREQAATERKFCAVLSVQDSPAPPTTERGRQVLAAITELRRSLGCPGVAPASRVTPTTYGPPPTGR